MDKENVIPLSECKDRTLYRIYSRNLRFGVFCKETGGFTGFRQKFSDVYLFEEYHWDLEHEGCGTVKPVEELEVLPEGIPCRPAFRGSDEPLETWLTEAVVRYWAKQKSSGSISGGTTRS